MDAFFIQILLLDEALLTLVFVGLFVAGGVIASRIMKVQREMGRIAYLWWLVAISAAMTVVSLVWLAVPRAADAGLLWLLIVAFLSATFGAGAFTYRISAARSNDIYGTTKKAWLGFVPIVNLVLMLSGGQSPRQISGAQKFIVNPLLVAVGLFVFGLIQIVDKSIANAPVDNFADSATLRSLVTNAMTLEESLRAEAEATQIDLPLAIDEITSMTEAFATGDTLTVVYDVSKPIVGFKPDFGDGLRQTYCGEDVLGRDIARGGRVLIIYRGPDGQAIETFDIHQGNCPG